MIGYKPVQPAARVAALDALRGMALCGILLINIWDMGGPIAMDRPMAPPAIADPDWQIWSFAHLFVTGTMRGLFSMLFGVGLILFVGSEEGAERSRLFFRRLLLLMIFGLIDMTLLLWPGDILLVYALAGLVALTLRPLRSEFLLLIAAVLLALLSWWAAREVATISPADTVYTAAALAREGAARLGSYTETLNYMSRVSWIWSTNATSYRWICDAAAFMLVGIALHRVGLFAADADPRLAWRMMIGGYGLGLPLRLLSTLEIFGNEGGPTLVSALVEQPGRLAMTLGHVGLFLLMWRQARVRAMLAPIGAMGRMALTLYLGQSLAGALVFSGFGLGLWNSLSWPRLWTVALLILLAQALFATAWFRRFRYGPVEWLWRLGTYGKLP